jgi:hypothetical protein
MNKTGIRYWVLGVRKIFFLLFFILSFILHPSSFIHAQHTRLYACALANDEPAAFMGGSSIGAGLWQTDDTGKTWMQIGWKHVKCYSVDVVNSSNGKIIYQACGSGVLKSTDAGITWRMLTDWRITEVLDIAIDQKAPNNIYIATPYAIWKSDDGGESWYEADTDIPEPRFTSRIKIDPVNHLKIYAATETGLYESKDGGEIWKKRNGTEVSVRDLIVSMHGLSAWIEASGHAAYFENQKWAFKDLNKDLWTEYKYDSWIYYGGINGVFSSSIKSNFLGGSPKNVHSIIAVSDNLFAGSLNGGVWKYGFAGETGTFALIGLDKLQIWHLKAIEIK